MSILLISRSGWCRIVVSLCLYSFFQGTSGSRSGILRPNRASTPPTLVRRPLTSAMPPPPPPSKDEAAGLLALPTSSALWVTVQVLSVTFPDCLYDVFYFRCECGRTGAWRDDLQPPSAWVRRPAPWLECPPGAPWIIARAPLGSPDPVGDSGAAPLVPDQPAAPRPWVLVIS